MIRFGALVATLALAAAPAMAQPAASTPVQVNVYLDSFNQTDNTYSGRVTVNANHCPNSSYGVGISVGGVKDEADARNKVKDQVARITNDFQKSASNCHR